jgi:hypothetical protein
MKRIYEKCDGGGSWSGGVGRTNGHIKLSNNRPEFYNKGTDCKRKEF